MLMDGVRGGRGCWIMETKTIPIKCIGADTLDFELWEEFQGNLKSSTKEDIDKLKRGILRRGILFPAFIWKYKKHNFIIDAHQRKKALKELREEGYEIGKYPVAWMKQRVMQKQKKLYSWQLNR